MKYSTRTFVKKMLYRRRHWDALIATIIEKGLARERVSEKWLVKDVISHVTAYDKELLRALETRSIVESPFWNVSVAARNDRIFDETQEVTLEEILDESARAFTALLEAVRGLSDDDLNSDVYITRKGDTRVTWDFVGANNFWHFEDHEDALIERFDLEYGG